ncbi:MAG: protein kinase [Anaerolineae bacterium]|nr:protein kinase [Anaerolineae bacterium]
MSNNDLVGKTLGQYEIISQVARGGMATVFRARQKSIARDVAIKVLPRSLMHGENFLERFYREVEVIAALQHPHILPVYDFGEFDDMPYIVMAYMSGGTLSDNIMQGPMNLPDAEIVIRQMADALDYAHSKGIIHRDFKPGNVLLDERGNTYLADFGLARITATDSQITGTGMLGTPTYMAPELAMSNTLSSAVDIYALGVTFFQMLTGRVPYEANTPLGVLMLHAHDPIPSIQEVRSDLNAGVQLVIERAMAKAAEDRYQTAGDMAKALSEAMNSGTQEMRGVSQADALLMTNMLGQVIFVDQTCLKLLKRHYADARQLIGKSMTEVLQISPKETEQLLQSVSKTGKIEKRPLEIKDAKGAKIQVLCTIIATRDDKGSFVGADLTLHPVAAADRSDFITVDKHLDTRDESYYQVYFQAQIKTLWDLAVQLGGKKLGANLDKIITETAQRNVWAITVQNGQTNIEVRSADADVYRALLAKAVAYVVSIVGKQAVAKGMQRVDERTDPGIMEKVGELKASQFFKDLLI